MVKSFFVSALLAVYSLNAVQIVPVPRTPESSIIALKIALPHPNQVVNSPPTIQFRIDGFALGAGSQFERAQEVAVSNKGQTIHVILDNHPYFSINEPALDPYDSSGSYYDTSYRFKIPFALSQGAHTIRMFPARSFGEGLKGDHNFAAINFYVGENKGAPLMDLSKPYLTYNEPGSEMHLSEKKPVLLDFYIKNAELSPGGYKVRLTVDKKQTQLLTSWQPYYLFGLKRGSHTIRLELLDRSNNKVPGSFNDVTQTISIH